MTAASLPGIRLAAWDKRERRKTVLEIGRARLGGGFTLLASLEGPADGPSAAAAASSLQAAGADILRWAGGEAEDLVRVREAAARAGLPALIEVTDTKEVGPAAAAADVLMVGAANMQNFSLLKELGRSAGKPVMIVRGWHATLFEWLNSAEYVLLEGNPRVILCEAGIRSFEGGSRVVLDLSAVPAVREISHLPIVVDIGSAGGPAGIERMGFAALAAGADGLMLEVRAAAGLAGPAGAGRELSLASFAGLAPKLRAMSRLLEGLGIDHA